MTRVVADTLADSLAGYVEKPFADKPRRHLLQLYEKDDKRVVVKTFGDRELYKREKWGYGYFGEIGFPTPMLKGHDDDKKALIIEWVEASEKPGILRAITDIAELHKKHMDSPLLDTPVLARHKERNVESFLRDYPEKFGPYQKMFLDAVQSGDKIDAITLIHGDLYEGNILTSGGKNKYIDFEFSGSGHPARDLAMLLINGCISLEDASTSYMESNPLNSQDLKRDLVRQTIIKGVQMIASLPKFVPDPAKRGMHHKRFLKGMNALIENY